MISNDPTRTAGIDRMWKAEINRRWSRFYSEVRNELIRLNRQPTIQINAESNLDIDIVDAYMIYFNQQIDRFLNGNWQEIYQTASYRLGMLRTTQEIKSTLRLGSLREMNTLEQIESLIMQTSATAPAYMSINPHRSAMSFLFVRAFDSLKGFNDQMSRQVRSSLFEGIEQGQGIAEITRNIKKRISVSRSRARLIAQTETIQAYQRAAINQADVLSETIGEEIYIQWETRRNSKVRPLHVSFHGQITTTKEAKRRMSISPYNCGCALVATLKNQLTDEDAKETARERRELKALTSR